MADENVAVQLNDGGRIRLSGKDIKNEKDDAVVLVNMNRLYLKQVRIIQKKSLLIFFCSKFYYYFYCGYYI